MNNFKIYNKTENNNRQTIPLNQILYGPPGTGKTYNTINKAIEIIENRTIGEHEDREDLKDKFQEYKKTGQIEFITFHQSYGYEEFVEGIKADFQSEDIKYKLEDGIFKQISNRAKENFEDNKKTSVQLSQEKILKQKLEIFLNDCLENETKFDKTKGGKFEVIEFNQDKITLYAEDSKYNNGKIFLKFNEFLQILNSNIELKYSRQMAKDILGKSNQRQEDTYYFSIYKEFKKFSFKNIEKIDISEALKNYVLIIDEINRGNISKIFGELITLIEPSKRIKANEEITLKLPYSHEEFGVPQNLYIIGTMNTADRSIALMDSALRRRFDFIEMEPDLEVLNGLEIEEINIKSMLEIINKRIQYLYDKDHTIGHAYLMNVETFDDLKVAFKDKIIPLLAEYFYDDWEKIRLVLGDQKKGENYQFVQIQTEYNLNNLFGNKNIESLNEELKIYSINKNAFDDKESYKKIYE